MIKRLIFAELTKKTSASYGARKYTKIQNTTPLEANPKQTTPVRILTTYFFYNPSEHYPQKISRYFKLSISFASFD
jgi:hypothetical protein